MNELEQLERNRVTKANQLARATYDLTLDEQRLLFLAISKINSPEIDHYKEKGAQGELILVNGTPISTFETTPFSVSAKEYSQIFGVGINSAYTQIKRAASKLKGRVITRLDGDVVEEINWTYKRRYIEKEGRIEIFFSRDLEEFLTNISGNFSTYQIKEIAKFKLKHTIKVFEYLKSLDPRKCLHKIEIGQLKIILALDTKSNESFGNFDSKILQPALMEINAGCSSMQVEYKKIKTGRSVTHIEFQVLDTSRDRVSE